MAWNPNLLPGSTEVDLEGLTEGTHPLVLEGGETPLEVVDDLVLQHYRFEGTVSRVGEDCQVRGSLCGNLVSACDRCLAPFEREASFELEVRVLRSGTTGDRGEEVTEGVIRLSPDETTIDLVTPFRAVILLDEPMKKLCREDCRGLCPVCGANRNESECDCDSSPGDSRWDALRNLPFPPPKE